MQGLGLNKIRKTGNPQMDALAVEVERAQIAAADAMSLARRASSTVERLESEMLRHRRHSNGFMVALILMAALIALALGGRTVF